MASSTSPLLPPLRSTSSSGQEQPISSKFFIPSPAEAAVFMPHPSLAVGSKVAVTSAGVGLLVSAVQNALETHNKGAMGIFTRTGGTIGFFTAMGFTFAFSQAAVANIRETDDALNSAAGGCAAGFLAGARAGSFPIGIASCAVLGTLLGTFDAAGKSLTGTDRQSIPRPEREQRRLEFFKKPKTVGEIEGASA
ncbi:hypothetical protein QFC22_000533 [Naganishia vaughanmartiniae]|uniref:Uncharacterized protein n=1 Tax=Naganishia vaughanmartiniae TaxID=1424756 RepID=A0ACC2XPL4_9TREE|nr:hypothetical protein QFC22_000533 [Naganishia vaughanmartiniae]